jgi:hypothetical protein
MNNEPRVFVIEPLRTPAIDLTLALEFGKLTYVFNSGERRSSVFDTDRFGATLLGKLDELRFNANIDSVCVAGSMITVAVAIGTIAQAYPEFNLLLFNSIHGVYVKVTIKPAEPSII